MQRVFTRSKVCATAALGVGDQRPHIVLLFPPDILIQIAMLLPCKDRLSLALACWTFHDVVTPFLYRSLGICLPPSEWKLTPDDPNPYSLLSCLVQSMRRPASRSSRFYTRYITDLSYRSFALASDMRAIPMLSEILCSSPGLRHLRLDVPKQSLPLVLDVFMRAGIIQPICPRGSQPGDGARVEYASLPSLESIRSCRVPVLAALRQCRPIKTLVADSSSSEMDLQLLFDFSTTWNTGELVRFSFSVPTDLGRLRKIVEELSGACSRLEELSIRCSSMISIQLLDHLLTMLPASPSCFPRLRIFAVNHAAFWQLHDDAFRHSEAAVVRAGERRDALQTICLGESMWYRTNSFSWIILWPDRPLCAVDQGNILYSGDPAILRMCLIQFSDVSVSHGSATGLDVKLSAFRCVSQETCAALQGRIEHGSLTPLSAFERFLLHSPPSAADAFFAAWTVDTILQMRCLSKATFLGIRAYARRTWSINAVLQQWFLRVPEFLGMLDTCDAIVAGWQAQQYFDRFQLRGTKLDVYVPCHALHRMGRWLQSQGFEYVALADQHVCYDVASLLFASAAAQYEMAGDSTAGSPPLPYSIFHFLCRKNHDGSQAVPNGRHIRMVGVRTSYSNPDASGI
ncbi:hypothetical protein OH77DRAFT_1515134, partial [Trametes cingulata]